VKILVVAVGRVKGSLASSVEEYEERARRYWKLRVTEVAAGGAGSRAGADKVREAEAERVLGRVPSDLDIVALSRAGDAMDSSDLAAYLEDLGTRGRPGVAFVIGGAFGLSDSVIRRAKRRLSLSDLTLPHEMARLVLAEQLYRAGTIIRGEPYHKG
jgi:23S rRNA (pseudouridine1915-N3)-methyltransferase